MSPVTLRRGIYAFATLACGLAILATSASAAVLSPVATTGHDVDIVFEAGLGAGDIGANGELGSRQFFEDGATAETDDGLPRVLPTFVSAISGNSIDFAFQPFEENNVVKFVAGNSAKTLTFTNPQPYTNLAVAFSGGSLAGTEIARLPYTINYEGGQTQTGSLNVVDWGAVAMPEGTEELFNADRTTANVLLWPVTSDNNTTAGRWSINVSEITPTHTDLNILSIDFGPATLNDDVTPLNSGDDVVVWGLAGTVVPEPSAAALGLAGIALMLRRRRPRQAT
jgi:hypothetical protein